MLTVVAIVAVILAPAPPAAADKPSIAGAWTMNKDQSDAVPTRSDESGGERGGGQRGGYGGGGRHGGYGGGRGGYGGGMGRGGASGGGGRMNPDDAARMRDAIRDLTNPSDHLTINETDSIIVITGADGHTTRLSPDGKKIKDENTGIERKTKWDGTKLVSEISGLGSGKATQTFVVVPETHQLRVTVQMEGRDGRGGNQPRTISHVYDADTQK
ncbi:MAG TPA: hypothetical protein VKE51_00240 [Vicinamibacterales bacterium]|nr:hypothetical protein [Vicinamibacterales bacterium]